MNEPRKGLLAEELDFYDNNKERFLHEHTNRHLLIKGRELIASFSTMGQAVGEGVRQFGSEPFLVRLSGTDTPTFIVPVLASGLPCQFGQHGTRYPGKADPAGRRSARLH